MMSMSPGSLLPPLLVSALAALAFAFPLLLLALLGHLAALSALRPCDISEAVAVACWVCPEAFIALMASGGIPRAYGSPLMRLVALVRGIPRAKLLSLLAHDP